MRLSKLFWSNEGFITKKRQRIWILHCSLRTFVFDTHFRLNKNVCKYFCNNERTTSVIKLFILILLIRWKRLLTGQGFNNRRFPTYWTSLSKGTPSSRRGSYSRKASSFSASKCLSLSDEVKIKFMFFLSMWQRIAFI